MSNPNLHALEPFELTAKDCARRRSNKFGNVVLASRPVIRYINAALSETADQNRTHLVYEVPRVLLDVPPYNVNELTELLAEYYRKQGFQVTIDAHTNALFIDFGHVSMH